LKIVAQNERVAPEANGLAFQSARSEVADERVTWLLYPQTVRISRPALVVGWPTEHGYLTKSRIS